MLTPATITVNFIGNYAGLHRICWRVCNTGTYSCTNIVECEGGGNPCSAVISIMVDPESCDPVCYEGYIQATCNAIDSPIGQVPFTVTYTPTPTCVGWTITCDNPEGCPAILPTEIGLNCDGSLRPQVEAMLEGETLSLCNRFEIPTLPAAYVMELNPLVTCCTCESYDVNFTTTIVPPPAFTNVYLYYTNCDKQLVKVAVPTPGTINSICAVPGSVSATGTLVGWNLNIQEGSATCP
jgi:hypothetical protein